MKTKSRKPERRRMKVYWVIVTYTPDRVGVIADSPVEAKQKAMQRAYGVRQGCVIRSIRARAERTR